MKSKRFKAFVNAKDAYESFIKEMYIRFDEMSEEHHLLARKDWRLKKAEKGFSIAIELSVKEDALADAAIAKYQLGLVHLIRGQFDAAAELINAAQEVLSNLIDRDRAPGVSDCHYYLGIIALKQCRLTDAVQELSLSRQLDDAIGNVHGMYLCDLALSACVKAGAETAAYSIPSPGDAANCDLSENTPHSTDGEDTASELEMGNGAIRYSQRELIFLASYSARANDELMAHLNSMSEEFGRPVSVTRVAFGSNDPQQCHLDPPEWDQKICAAILVLEKAGLKDRAFREFAASCMRQVNAIPDFRLLVHLHDLTIDELWDIANREPLVAKMIDMLIHTTHLPKSLSVEKLRRALVPYLRRIEHIRTAAYWRKLRPKLAVICGRLATAILIAAALLSLLGLAAGLLKWKLDWLGSHGPQLASLILGILAFPVQAPLIFLLLRGMSFTALASRYNTLLLRWVFVGALIMDGANYLQHVFGGTYSWLFLGVAAGILLDSIHRAGREAQRQMIDVDGLMKGAKEPEMEDPNITILRGDPLNPFYCPLLPALSARVFISYTPRSTKGSRLAATLYHGLKRVGASPFLDKFEISVGASFVRDITAHLGQCDAFLCILDEKSVESEWVATELLAALEGHRLTGVPEIIILVDPAIKDPIQPMLPIFRGVISASALPHIPGRPQILELNAQTQTSLVWGLAPKRFNPTSVFTRTGAIPIVIVTPVLVGVGVVGIFAGPILGFLAILEGMAKFPLTSGLAIRGWLEPITFLTAFWLGFTARATIAFGYEREHDRDLSMTIPAIATAGLAFALFLFVPRVSLLAIGWSAVLTVAGWIMATFGTERRVKKK